MALVVELDNYTAAGDELKLEEVMGNLLSWVVPFYRYLVHHFADK
jgi:hypothetical protein